MLAKQLTNSASSGETSLRARQATDLAGNGFTFPVPTIRPTRRRPPRLTPPKISAASDHFGPRYADGRSSHPDTRPGTSNGRALGASEAVPHMARAARLRARFDAPGASSATSRHFHPRHLHWCTNSCATKPIHAKSHSCVVSLGLCKALCKLRLASSISRIFCIIRFHFEPSARTSSSSLKAHALSAL